jgi:hypothetical protein
MTTRNKKKVDIAPKFPKVATFGSRQIEKEIPSLENHQQDSSSIIIQEIGDNNYIGDIEFTDEMKDLTKKPPKKPVVLTPELKSKIMHPAQKQELKIRQLEIEEINQGKNKKRAFYTKLSIVGIFSILLFFTIRQWGPAINDSINGGGGHSSFFHFLNPITIVSKNDNLL